MIHFFMDLDEIKNNPKSLRSYTSLPLSLRSKIVKDTIFCSAPRIDFLEQLLPLESQLQLKKLIQTALNQLHVPATEEINAQDENVIRVVQAMSSKDPSIVKRAFLYAVNTRQAALLPHMLSMTAGGANEFCTACCIRLMSFLGVRFYLHLVDYLRIDNPKLVKMAVEGLAQMGALEARDTFFELSLLAVSGQTYLEKLGRKAISSMGQETEFIGWLDLLQNIDTVRLSSVLYAYCMLHPADARDTLMFSITNRIAGIGVNLQPLQEVQSQTRGLPLMEHEKSVPSAAVSSQVAEEALSDAIGLSQTNFNVADLSTDQDYAGFLAQEQKRIAELKQYTEDADPEVRLNALEALNSLLNENERDFFASFLTAQPASIVTLCAVAVSRDPNFEEKYLEQVETSLQTVAFSGDDQERQAVLECIVALQRERWIELAEVVLFSLISSSKEAVRKAADTLRSWALVSARASQLLENFLISERQFDNWSLSYNEDSLLESWDFPDVLRTTLESGSLEEKAGMLNKILSDHVLPTDEDATLKILKLYLKSETNTVLLSQLIQCITRLSVADEWPRLEPYLQHESLEVVKTTVRALAALKDMRLLRFVEPLLTEIKDLRKLEIVGSAFPLLVKRHESAGVMLLNAMISFGEQTDELFHYCLKNWEEPNIKSCEKIISLISAKMGVSKAQSIAAFLGQYPGWSRKLLHISLSSIPDNICDIFTGGSLCTMDEEGSHASSRSSDKKLTSIESIKNSFNSFWKKFSN